MHKRTGDNQEEIPEMLFDQANSGQSSGRLHGGEHFTLQCIGPPLHGERGQKYATFMDKSNRCIWSDKNGQPLRQMDERHPNMADIREQLNVTPLRTKIEQTHLLRLGHILKMNDDRLVT